MKSRLVNRASRYGWFVVDSDSFCRHLLTQYHVHGSGIALFLSLYQLKFSRTEIVKCTVHGKFRVWRQVVYFEDAFILL